MRILLRNCDSSLLYNISSIEVDGVDEVITIKCIGGEKILFTVNGLDTVGVSDIVGDYPEVTIYHGNDSTYLYDLDYASVIGELKELLFD